MLTDVQLTLAALVEQAQAAGRPDVARRLQATLDYSLRPVNWRATDPRFVESGRKGGRSRSPAKADAARRNGQRGGRPKK